MLLNGHSDACPLHDDLHVEDTIVYRFHREVLPGYAAITLKKLKLGGDMSQRFQGKVYLKMESDRYGLPAFKVLGAPFVSYFVLY